MTEDALEIFKLRRSHVKHKRDGMASKCSKVRASCAALITQDSLLDVCLSCTYALAFPLLFCQFDRSRWRAC